MIHPILAEYIVENYYLDEDLGKDKIGQIVRAIHKNSAGLAREPGPNETARGQTQRALDKIRKKREEIANEEIAHIIQQEGYADSYDGALAITEAMSEEWMNDILEEFITEAKHGPRNAKERRKQRGENLSRILKRRLGTKASIRGRTPEHIHTTPDPDDVSIEIRKYKNPAHYAAGETPKVNTINGRNKVVSNRTRAFRAKKLLQQITRNRRNPKGSVFTADIVPNLDRDHGDFENIKQRTRNLKAAVGNVPREVEHAGGKPGDVVIGKPGQTQGGGPERAGRESRARLYKRLLPNSSNLNPVTNRMMGRLT